MDERIEKTERKELEKQLVNEKIRFTQLWVERMLNSTNKKWSGEQKDFVDALFKNVCHDTFKNR